MVAERVVLRRVEHLEQRRRGIAAVVGADLVDLVEQDDGVHRSGLADRTDQAAGQRTDVRTTVAADLGLVTYAAECDADEVAAQRTGDALAQRRLADAGRADERHDGAGPASADDLETAFAAAGAYGEVLHDAVLDVVEAVVVGVEHLARGGDVGVVLGLDAPWELQHGVEPRADVARLRVLVAAALELADLAQGRLADVLGEVRLLDPGAVVLGAFGLVVAELLADRGELLAQHELALVLVDALLHRLRDLLVDLALGEVGARPLDQQGQPQLDLRGLEELALLLEVEVRRIARGVRECARVGQALHGVDDLPRVALLQDRHEQALVVAGQLAYLLGDRLVVDQLGLDPERGARAGHAALDVGALLGLDHGAGATAGEATDLLDGGDHAVGGVAVLESRGDQELVVIAGAGGIDGGSGGIVELDGNDHAGEDDDVLECQHGEGFQCAHGSLLRVESDGLNLRRGVLVPVERPCSLRADSGMGALWTLAFSISVTPDPDSRDRRPGCAIRCGMNCIPERC